MKILFWKKSYCSEKWRTLETISCHSCNIDETWIDSNQPAAFANGLEDAGTQEKLIEFGRPNASRRVTVLCAGGSMGFLPSTSLVYKAYTTKGDYTSQMNSSIFEKWAKACLHLFFVSLHIYCGINSIECLGPNQKVTFKMRILLPTGIWRS